MTARWLGLLVLGGMWITAAAAFPHLPAEVPTHWNLAGEADGWTPRFPGAFLLPAIATGVWLLLLAQPAFDPRREQVKRFTETRLLLANVIVLFSAGIHAATIGSALGWPIEMGRMVGPATGLLLIVLGNYMPRVRSNWFIGLRTPWTLSSDRVWQQSHRIAGWSLMVAGLLLMVNVLLPPVVQPWVAGAAIGLAAVIPAAYSFFAWRKERDADSSTASSS